MKPLREKHRAVFYILVLTACALLAFIILVDLLLLLSPVNPWFHAEIIISGSMEPTIRTGSMIIVVPQDSYSVGDIITFIDPIVGKNTHRIIAVAERDGVTYFITMGDAAEGPDAIPVSLNRVKGKVRAIVPWLGYVAYAGFAAILVPLGLLLLYVIRKLRSRHDV